MHKMTLLTIGREYEATTALNNNTIEDNTVTPSNFDDVWIVWSVGYKSQHLQTYS